MTTAVNPNALWAGIVVEQLARCGLEAACIAPGSRSTPLTLAFDRHPAVQVYLHLDERSAAFFALGLAQATGRPVALVCTSGTAAAEFHPAVVEAYQAQIPLLVLTADRPHELRESGANQTIDQVKMYGDHVLWAMDVALPEAAPPAVALRNLRTLAARAYACAAGLRSGPVHLNFPFRKPLEPASPAAFQAVEEQVAALFAQPPGDLTVAHGEIQPTPTQVQRLAEAITGAERGLIVCGPRRAAAAGPDFADAVTALARASGYPILADPASGLRFGPHVADAPLVGAYDALLAAGDVPWPPPQLVLRLGAVPTSAALNAYLERVAAPTVHIRSSGVWADDSHLVHSFLQADPTLTCRRLAAELSPRGLGGWAQGWLAGSRAAGQVLAEAVEQGDFEGAAVAAAIDGLPAGANLFVGNSLPIRHVDRYGLPRLKPLQVFVNRGASGIDGITSTALGVAAAAPDRPTLLITGDISFYHDMNGLLALGQFGLGRFCVVLLNNRGGGIFRRLPVARFEPSFTHLFLTPHDLRFELVAQLYGLAYQQVAPGPAVGTQVSACLAEARPTLIEVPCDSAQDLAMGQVILQRVARVALQVDERQN